MACECRRYLPLRDEALIERFAELSGPCRGLEAVSGNARRPAPVPLYQPGGDWFPKASKGVYVDGAATLVVDSGVGVTGPPLRFLNQSQVTLHRITPAP